jgi:hypothetical protein
VAGVCYLGWKFTSVGHAPDYQSHLALILYARVFTVHGGLFFVYIRVIGQFISGVNA